MRSSQRFAVARQALTLAVATSVSPSIVQTGVAGLSVEIVHVPRQETVCVQDKPGGMFCTYTESTTSLSHPLLAVKYSPIKRIGIGQSSAESTGAVDNSDTP
jgi:hypothetical protein